MRPVRHRENGQAALEAAIFVPVLILLLLGTIEFGRLAYTYYTLNKMMYTAARYAGTQQGVNFCDDADASITAAKGLALTGTADSSGDPLIANLSADMIAIRAERVSATSGDIQQCDCTATGCDASQGGLPPDFIVVSIPQGYPFLLRIPGLPTDPIQLHPSIRIPYSGT